jgi:transposase
MTSKKFTIFDFNEKYKTNDDCLYEIFKNRYGHLEDFNKYYKVTDRKCYAHSKTGKQIHPLANTIFHKSDTPLKLWFYAIFLFCASKNGVSAKELERQLGVTYKTAWRMAKQIRRLFDDTGSAKLKNEVEIDETYIGGKEKNKHADKKTGSKGASKTVKTAVIGAVQRKDGVVARVIDNATESEVKPFVRSKVDFQSTIYTDENPVYDQMKYSYDHQSVNHSKQEYVKGDIYTNSIEGFWSQLKRSIDGTYHMVSPKYLQQYVNEFSWRYNQRDSRYPLFGLLIRRV